jgi:hypothetical protein
MPPPARIVDVLGRDFVARLADQVRRTIARDLIIAAREGREAKVFVHLPEPIGGDLGDVLELLPAFPQRLLHLLDVGDIDE